MLFLHMINDSISDDFFFRLWSRRKIKISSTNDLTDYNLFQDEYCTKKDDESKGGKGAH